MEFQRILREKDTPIIDAGSSLQALDDLWVEILDQPSGDFIASIFGKMWSDEDLDADRLEHEFIEMMLSEDPGKTVWYGLAAVMHVACAHCVAAMKAEKSGKLNVAWSHVSDARYYVGIAYGIQGEKTGRMPAAHIKGGAAIAARAQLVGDHAFDLAIKGNYASRAAAIRAIKNDVMQFAREHCGWTMSEMQAGDTIDGYLKVRGYAPRAS